MRDGWRREEGHRREGSHRRNEGWKRLFRNPFGPGAERRAIEEEMAFHLEELERRLVVEGMTAEEAAAEARRRFGSPEAWRDEAVARSRRRRRAGRRRSFVAAFVTDLTASARQLRRRVPSTVTALVIMTLGIASGTAVWAVMDAILFRPLPFPDSGRVVAVTGTNQRSINWWLSPYTYERFREAQRSFSAMAATREARVTILEPYPDELGGLRVESTFFDVLGIAPAVGRAFAPDDDVPGASEVAILTHDLWRSRFGGDPGILGTELLLGGGTATVVGVMPEGFRWEADQFDQVRTEGAERRIFLNGALPDASEVAAFGRIMPVARLAEDASIASAHEDLDRIARGLVAAHPEAYGGEDTEWGPMSAQVWSVRERLLWLVEDQVWLLAPGVLLLLALVSLNSGGLMVVAILDRRGELALRASLGASRARLAVQVLLESGVQWVTAFVVGIGLAATVLPTIRDLTPDQVPFTDLIAMDPRVLGGAAVLTVFLWLTSSLAPLFFGSRVELLSLLKAGGWSGTRRLARAQHGLIVLQMILACGLAGGAALVVDNYASMLDVPPGVTKERVLALDIRPPIDLFNRPTTTVGELGGPWDDNVWLTADEQLYGPGERLDALVRESLDRLRAVPGVRSAAFTNMPPFWSSLAWRGVLPPDQSRDTPRAERDHARAKWVSPGYFGAVGLPVIRGRPLLPSDNADAAKVVVVNEAFVERFLPDEPDPLGRSVPLDVSAMLPPDEWTVVGIVPNVLHYGPHQPEEPAFYLPVAQIPEHWTSDQVGWTRVMWFLVEHDDDPASVLPAVREAIWSMVPGVPIRSEATLAEMRHGLTGQTRFFVALLGTFAAIALVLATAGLMAMLGQQVRHRTREYGLRKALGAGIPDVLARTIKHGASLAAVGIVGGTLVAWLLSGLLAGLVVGVDGWSPVAQAVVAVLLMAAAVAASLGPALRAARVDPIISLKAD